MVKMSILPKAIYRVNATPFEIFMAYFNRSREKTVLKGIYIEPQKILNSQRNPERENKSGGITLILNSPAKLLSSKHKNKLA